jgi:hypothetical protein
LETVTAWAWIVAHKVAWAAFWIGFGAGVNVAIFMGWIRSRRAR